MTKLDNSIEEVAKALGVALVLRKNSEDADSGYSFAISLNGFKRPQKIEYRVREGLLSWTFELYLDHFPGELLHTMNQAFFKRRSDILGLLEAIKGETSELTFAVNDLPVEEIIHGSVWDTLEIRLKYRFKTEESRDIALTNALFGAFSILLVLITEDESDLDVGIEEGYEEGKHSLVLKNHYERSRVNRALCLKWNGFSCKACGLNMESVYGPLGSGVIHVHHLEPVSQLGVSTRVNPRTDLVPLCPNCHVIIHKKNPPLTIEELVFEIQKNPIISL